MTTTQNIVFDGGDDYEDGPIDSDSDSMGDDSSGGSTNFPTSYDTYSGDAPAGARRYRFEKIDPDKEANREIQKENLANKRDLRNRQAEAKTDLQRRSQDADRRAREAQREQMSRTAEQMAQIRANAVSERIQAYSVSSFLGVPGYIGASAYDQYITRPNEQQQIAEMKRYQEQLRAYNAQEAQRRIDEKRQAEDEIRNMPIDATDASAIRQKYGLSPNSGAPVPPGGSGNPPGTNPPPGGQQPPILPPTFPTPPQPGSSLLAAMHPVAIAFEAVQRLNQGIDKVAKDISGNVGDMLDGPATKGLGSAARTVRQSFDPLGVNIPGQIAVSGFETLLSLTEDIKKAAEKDLAFSPMSLAASVESNLAKLLQSISIAERLDPTKAEVIKLQTQLDMVWEEMKAELFVTLAPAIMAFMRSVITILETMVTTGRFTSGFLSGLGDQLPTWLQMILKYLGTIAKNTDSDPFADLDQNGILAKIATFLDPAQAKVIFPNP